MPRHLSSPEWLCRTVVVLLTKKAVETYLYCVPFAITMDRFGMAGASES